MRVTAFKQLLTGLPKTGFPLGEFVHANREKSNLIGWRQTLTSSPANYIRFLLVENRLKSTIKVIYLIQSITTGGKHIKLN